MKTKLCAGVSPEQDKWCTRLTATIHRCDKSFRADRAKLCSRHFETYRFSMYTFIYAWELAKLGAHNADLFFVNRKLFLRNVQHRLVFIYETWNVFV